jgi:hypothetical protein
MKSLKMAMNASAWRTGFHGISVAVIAGVLFAGPVAVLAQAVTSAEAARPVDTDGKPLAFDVVSIRETTLCRPRRTLGKTARRPMAIA